MTASVHDESSTMFHVYGVGGRLYSGGAENLPVVPVQRLERLSSVQNFMVDERPPEEPAAPAPQRSALGHDAVAAYGQAASPQFAPTRLPRVAAQFMSTVVVTVQADATLEQAAAWMAREHVGQAPVIDERQQLVGMLGRAQIVAGAADPEQAVRSAMLSPVPAALPETDVHLVAKALLQTDLPGLPVVDGDGRLCGFIARGDLLRVLADEPALEVWA
ncbi:CBS domain-containing protein [Xylophilus sp. GOD-11R]|uniref:CBS domain-containing protein n=1 Tax=Xylophilus sp. GOD-11R TaxID=3089814 RepID=UPI00298C1F15|nr:CBS domain-containing protein [Xylophilus sp. GOD-11R]WPB56080.1 CBS domain-containing protein [Xylophilus sp. GOD-11R]